jgi:hypothetical protein
VFKLIVNESLSQVLPSVDGFQPPVMGILYGRLLQNPRPAAFGKLFKKCMKLVHGSNQTAFQTAFQTASQTAFQNMKEQNK